MQFDRFSRKQLITLTWWQLSKYKAHDAIVCDGSVRSGKTLAMTVGFMLWSMATYENQTFAICGKTIESLRRNVILPMHTWLEGVFTIHEKRSQNCVEITYGGTTNRYFLFGGRDESSYALIQGITLAGIMMDEVALMPRSFVEQALARCSVEGSRFWFNCNPEYPEHWFHKEWVLNTESKNALHLHYTMNDNLSLSPDVRQRYEALYSGVFYERYILGHWVLAEGRIYPAQAKGFGIVPVDQERRYTRYFVSVDYGTVNPFSAGLWGFSSGVWYRMREYYWDSKQERRQLTDGEYYTALDDFIGGLPVVAIIVDPSAASFITCILRAGKYRAVSANNDVVNGIRRVAAAFAAEKVKMYDCCTYAQAEFSSYRWDDKSTKDAPIKENDHAMDDIRYFVNTVVHKDTAGIYRDVRI